VQAEPVDFGRFDHDDAPSQGGSHYLTVGGFPGAGGERLGVGKLDPMARTTSTGPTSTGTFSTSTVSARTAAQRHRGDHHWPRAGATAGLVNTNDRAEARADEHALIPR
jgi:hypothetical protein